MTEPEALPEHIGPYRVTGRLGRGGMGEVLRGHDDRLDRPVALKRIHPGGKDPEKARQRFRREARVVARLSHQAVVGVYDWVEADDQDWLVMELVDGRPLDAVLAEGPLPAERAATIAREVASGLAAAHEAGLVHRDLKAANVMVKGSGGSPERVPPDRIKILDFGIAKAVGLENAEGRADELATLTEAGQLIGTVASMSPEQAMGRPVDHRSDLFSLGTLLYQMLSGVSPFEAASALETLTRICRDRETPLRSLDSRIPEDLAKLVARLLEKEPARRPADARQVMAELDQMTAAETGSDSGSRPPPAPEPGGSGSQDLTLLAGAWGERRSVVRTLLLSDLVDSTKLVERLGDERAAAVFEQHDRLARKLLAEHEGREVDKTDGFLHLFSRPLAAVGYALAYHAALEDLSQREGVELSSRVGIHVGEVVVRENDPADVARGAKPLEVEGLAKAVAARFMGLARGGQTLISRGVYGMARRASVGADGLPEGLRWAEHGRYRMKGVEEPVGVFEVGVEGAAPLAAPADSEKVTRVMEESDTYSIRKVSGRWVLAAAVVLLIVVGLWGWSSRWRLPAKETPDVVLSSTTTGLSDELADFNAAYEKGMALLERFDQKGNLDQAMVLFQALVASHPDSAAAHAGLSRTLWRKHRVSPDRALLDQARSVAQRAVQLEPYLASGHVSLGLVRLEQGDLDAADGALEQALRLNPASAEIHRGLGQLHEARGQIEDAELAYRRALEIRPKSWELYAQLGTFYFNLSRLDEAAKAFRRSIVEAPDSIAGFSGLSGVYFMQGRYDKAAAELQKAIAIRPHAMLYANLGNIFFYQGLYELAIAPFRKAVELPEGARNPAMWGNLGDAYRWAPSHEEDARSAYSRGIALLRPEAEARPDDTPIRSRLALYMARIGSCDEAMTVAAELESFEGIGASEWFRLVLTHEQCDRRQRALSALERALATGYPLVRVEGEQELDRLRTDPGFRPLRARYSG